jgi:hypothetical protein
MTFTRVYHPYHLWEEIKFNMWGEIDNRKTWLELAINFTGNHVLYGQYMRRVITEWPISCENALTDQQLNKRAWIGHAACALAVKCPEHIVREAWGKLTDEQRLLANKEADRAIQSWNNTYAKHKGICEYMGVSLL